jgi:spore coat polysaccharide biosynthesis protein SpsF
MALRAGFVTLPEDAETALPADVWVVDLQEGCPPEVAAEYRPLCGTLIIMNGVGWNTNDPARLLADLVFYQGVCKRPYEMNWDDFTGEWYEGPEWVILRPQFAEHRRLRTEPHDPPRVLVMGGGVDKGGVTDTIITALAGQYYDLRVIMGKRAVNVSGGEMCLERDGAKFIYNPPNIAESMAWADVAVISYGMTAFECMALGLPPVALSLGAAQLEGARLVTKRGNGALLNLGLVKDVVPADIQGAVRGALGNLERRSQSCLDFVDGLGAGRVADKIVEAARNG